MQNKNFYIIRKAKGGAKFSATSQKLRCSATLPLNQSDAGGTGVAFHSGLLLPRLT